ncbi:MAG TPA: CmcJ/NvfI family oxidoreductase [Alphaproteobacteria bacterium]|nr:CmcJ/NvfI family oxidoreductase [Alphaproteobacteria bacterium]
MISNRITDTSLQPAIEPVSRAGDFVIGNVLYLEDANQTPIAYNLPQSYGMPTRSGRFATLPVRIKNARNQEGDLTLDGAGFVLARYATSVKNFYDEAEVRAIYYPEVERLVRESTGAEMVVIFDHTLRTSDGADQTGSRGPARVVHNDYTETSGPQRARDFLPAQEALTRLRRRFVEINVWRPIRGPVRRDPLGLIDGRSIAAGDLVTAKLIYSDRTGEIYYGAHNPAHRWYYFPEMAADEAILVKCYDSAKDGRTRFSLHAAFEDPSAPADAPPRESIEVRTFAFFDG